MCNKAVEKGPWMVKYVPDQYKTQEMYKVNLLFWSMIPTILRCVMMKQ